MRAVDGSARVSAALGAARLAWLADGASRVVAVATRMCSLTGGSSTSAISLWLVAIRIRAQNV